MEMELLIMTKNVMTGTSSQETGAIACSGRSLVISARMAQIGLFVNCAIQLAIIAQGLELLIAYHAPGPNQKLR